jgi:cytochrome P450
MTVVDDEQVNDEQVKYDPYDLALNTDPYPALRRLREEAPLYYNARYDFYALSRFDDVNEALVDHRTFSSSRGVILELIKADISAILLLVGAANRDQRQLPPDGDVFDIHRAARSHLAFGVGAHYCLGSALARLEGRIALDEVLTRFPEWEIDLANASLSSTAAVRGWDALPARV